MFDLAIPDFYSEVCITDTTSNVSMTRSARQQTELTALPRRLQVNPGATESFILLRWQEFYNFTAVFEVSLTVAQDGGLLDDWSEFYLSFSQALALGSTFADSIRQALQGGTNGTSTTLQSLLEGALRPAIGVVLNGTAGNSTSTFDELINVHIEHLRQQLVNGILAKQSSMLSSPLPSKKKNSSRAVVGMVVSSVCLAGSLIVLALVVWRRRRRSKIHPS